MTVPATARRAGPYNGNGSTTSFPFTFKTYAAGDLLVVKTSSLNVDSTLVLNSSYSVTLNGDQDASPGGTITYPITGAKLASGEKLTILSALEYEQTTDLLGGGAFNARVIEDTFDRTVVQIQQLGEQVGRALKLPVASLANPILPAPQPESIFAWDSTGNALQNISLEDLPTAVAFGNYHYNIFTGDGSTTTFTLSGNPVLLSNVQASIGGVVQLPGVDFSLSGLNLVFSSAPPNGASVLVHYGLAVISQVYQGLNQVFDYGLISSGVPPATADYGLITSPPTVFVDYGSLL
jgi:hypothetical protein